MVPANISEKSQAKPRFNFEKLTNTIFEFFKFFSILQMLWCIPTYVFRHQISIVAISLILNTKNDWFEVELSIFQKKIIIFEVILILKSIWVYYVLLH